MRKATMMAMPVPDDHDGGLTMMATISGTVNNMPLMGMVTEAGIRTRIGTSGETSDFIMHSFVEGWAWISRLTAYYPWKYLFIF